MFDRTMFDRKPDRPRFGGCSTAILLIVLLLAALIISSCSAADTASYNLSKSADAFQVTRRIIFYNGITGDYMLQVEGLCSLGNSDISGEISIFFSFFSSMAAIIMASACISAISGYVTASLQPLCPSMGLNS